MKLFKIENIKNKTEDMIRYDTVIEENYLTSTQIYDDFLKMSSETLNDVWWDLIWEVGIVI